jgi:hypothetical protein
LLWVVGFSILHKPHTIRAVCKRTQHATPNTQHAKKNQKGKAKKRKKRKSKAQAQAASRPFALYFTPLHPTPNQPAARPLAYAVIFITADTRTSTRTSKNKT